MGGGTDWVCLGWGSSTLDFLFAKTVDFCYLRDVTRRSTRYKRYFIGISARRGGVNFPNEVERVFASENRRKGSPFGAGHPPQGNTPPVTAAPSQGRRGDGRSCTALVTCQETRLSSCTGKGGWSIGYGRLVSVHAEGRKHAVGGS